MRAGLLLIHRYSGLASMVFLAIAALTGCLLIFRAPIDRALNPDLFFAPSESASGPLETIAAVNAFAFEYPTLQVLSFPLNSPAGSSIAVDVASKPGEPAPDASHFFLDPRDGAVIGSRTGEPSWGARGFVSGVTELHFDLLAGTAGRLFLGTIAAIWFISSFVGFFLTFPERGPFWKGWKRNWQFRRSSSFPRLLLDLHRASGLWFLPLLLLLALTSVAFNFWQEAYAPAVTAISPLEHDLFDQPVPFPEGTTPKLGFSDAYAIAAKYGEAKKLAWQPATMLYLPQWNLYGVKFARGGVLNYEKLGPVDYYFDGDTGAYRHQVDPYSDSAGLVMIRMVYPLHSGEVFGTASLIVVFVLGIVTFGQSLTGLYIWWKKRASRVAQRHRKFMNRGSAK